MESNKDSDFPDTRRLTIENPNIRPTFQDIDSQITDLENLIRRLQDEIVEMSKAPDSNDEVNEDQSSTAEENKNSSVQQICQVIEQNVNKNSECHLGNDQPPSTTEENKNLSSIQQIYQVIEQKAIEDAESRLGNHLIVKDSDICLNIRNNFKILWDDNDGIIAEEARVANIQDLINDEFLEPLHDPNDDMYT